MDHTLLGPKAFLAAYGFLEDKMAQALRIKYCTFVGTAEQISNQLRLLIQQHGGASAVSIEYSNFVTLAKPVDSKGLELALKTTPQTQRG